MISTTHRATVLAAGDLPFRPIPGANASCRIAIDRTTGCQNLVQRVFRFEAGLSPQMLNATAEDVIYVVAGAGEAVVAGDRHTLKPATGLLVPPGVPYRIHNPGPEALEYVSVLSPQPEHPDGVSPSPQAKPIGPHGVTVHASEEQPLPAGDDRTFKLMIDPRHGCRYVTQFIGFIDKSRAPFHTHTYEEVIYILSGEGIVHIADGHFPIRAGSSIYLSPGTPHCLENAGEETLCLLGVFCPAGSPADKKEKE